MAEHSGIGGASSVGVGPAENAGNASSGAGVLQPSQFEFDQESRAQIDRILGKYPPSRRASGAIPVLYVAQEQMRRQTGSAWVPRVAMDAVAGRLGVPPIRVYEIATFYLMFNIAPIGRYHVQVCTTTPCWLRGSDEVVRACRDVTGIGGWKQNSADGLFTISEVECLGACVNAPVLQVDDDYYEDLDYERTVTILRSLTRGERPRAGSTIGRMTSAPEGGPNTLLREAE